jgi:hypothetical protein
MQRLPPCARRLDGLFNGPEINDADFIGDVVTEMVITATQMGNTELVSFEEFKQAVPLPLPL